MAPFDLCRKVRRVAHGLFIDPSRFAALALDEPAMQDLEVDGRASEGSEAEIPGAQEDVLDPPLQLLVVGLVSGAALEGALAQGPIDVEEWHRRYRGSGASC